MKIMQTVAAANGLSLQASERPTPTPGPDEVLIRVHAAGIITAELDWQPTTHKADGSPRSNAIPTHEFSGDIAACGEGVKSFTEGQAIYGMNDWYQEGALAEFTVAPATSIALRPKSLSYEQAATVPIGALTAWQALTTHGHLQPQQRVLIHGGAGGVGFFAVQFAKSLGAYVIATASADTIPFVKSLGADQILDYRATRFDQELRDIDLVVDTVGGETLARSWNVLRSGGRVVTAASDIPDDAPHKIKDAFFLVQPDGKQLSEIAGLLDAGKLRTFVKAIVPLQDAEQAYNQSISSALRYGKTVVALAP
ncbi:MAG TPA: NADP-dependent oxidoreductase [Edaphobacter sp.]|uniref:NADP-dependent oxidoreductase n=1 Tax=Edaphobacter sp. TaxID=1934404 RepID=UPI002B9E92D4|nr:NADP-dependent oxidoreductase [Edaphobacter sp.]HUZ93417.1 NADP-dependent oxidoreductase [Edaphobacter sp.]